MPRQQPPLLPTDITCLCDVQEEVGAERVQRLSVVLLGTRQSTLRIIQRYPAMLDMQPGHLMERLVWFKVRGGQGVAWPGCICSHLSSHGGKSAHGCTCLCHAEHPLVT